MSYSQFPSANISGLLILLSALQICDSFAIYSTSAMLDYGACVRPVFLTTLLYKVVCLCRNPLYEERSLGYLSYLLQVSGFTSVGPAWAWN